MNIYYSKTINKAYPQSPQWFKFDHFDEREIIADAVVKFLYCRYMSLPTRNYISIIWWIKELSRVNLSLRSKSTSVAALGPVHPCIVTFFTNKPR